jgi:hypothetical protein
MNDQEDPIRRLRILHQMTAEELDPIRRLRILAAMHPGCALAEALLDAPFDAVWAITSDLENGVRRYEPTVKYVHIVQHRGDRIILTAGDVRGRRHTFHAILRPGWCWMQSGSLLVGMAARAEHERTRIAHLEGSRAPLGEPPNPQLEHKLHAELARIEQLARQHPTQSQ